MKKYTPNGNRIIVTSRGIKTEMACGLIIPEGALRKSNLCKTEDGRTVIIKDHHYIELPDGRWLVDKTDVLAFMQDGKIIPEPNVIHCRKCEDPESDIVISVTKRATQFAEILAAGCRTGVEDSKGWLVYVKEDADPQPVEDSDDEWLVLDEDVLMAVKGE